MTRVPNLLENRYQILHLNMREREQVQVRTTTSSTLNTDTVCDVLLVYGLSLVNELLNVLFRGKDGFEYRTAQEAGEAEFEDGCGRRFE